MAFARERATAASAGSPACSQARASSTSSPGSFGILTTADSSTARASFAFYNTRAEIDRLVAALHTAREMLG